MAKSKDSKARSSSAHGRHAAASHEARDRHGNPADLEAYLRKMESPERAEWQRPDAVVRALGLKRGQSVCEVGAGPGYFSLRLAKAVGPRGTVFAVEVEPRILEVLRGRIAQAGARNVVPILGLEDDPLVPPGSCDLVLMVDAIHHIQGRPAFLRRLARALRPGGRVALIDFHKRELPVGPPVDHKLAREELLREIRAAGLALVSEPDFLPYQYFLILEPGRARALRADARKTHVSSRSTRV
jgi:ubiquinone/menaquinone biosynthesis C-methylase UbiE